MSVQSKRFCFTLNNYTDADEKNVQKMDTTFVIYGHEIAPTTGTPHLQGYVEMAKKITMKGICKLLPKASFKICSGNADQNITYCEKEGKDIYKRGTPMKQGERGDIKQTCDAILAGSTTTEQILITSPMYHHMYGRTFNKVEDLRMRKLFRTEMTTCTWYFGETGVGKSHKAYENYHPDTHYNWKNDGGWQDGYTQQKTIIINEYRGHIKYGDLLQMVDKWPYEVRRRNREPMPFTSTHIIITSALPPNEIYNNLSGSDSLGQLARRIKVYELKELKDKIEEIEYAICQEASLQTPSKEDV